MDAEGLGVGQSKTLSLGLPPGIFVDGGGRTYMTDRSNGRIVRVDDMTGAGLIAVGTQGDGTNQFDFPAGIAVDGGVGSTSRISIITELCAWTT